MVVVGAGNPDADGWLGVLGTRRGALGGVAGVAASATEVASDELLD